MPVDYNGNGSPYEPRLALALPPGCAALTTIFATGFKTPLLVDVRGERIGSRFRAEFIELSLPSYRHCEGTPLTLTATRLRGVAGFTREFCTQVQKAPHGLVGAPPGWEVWRPQQAF